ncbi:class I SAM-dependent methyltransferase [Marinobacter daepoensis]|uniref:class I SAM-dependent methyltransferase n=1 Tax=Marinobacter daepoensis TaxID=262077 RepID=UPI001C98B576|nr:class I SAM-dependent methyltransferase [Marinobacter daepoensis]MBY6034103.1 class I SAM-dependent methyltransferase [Marinobacter daepoensis]
MENRYGKLASWVYHLDKPIGRSFGDIEFYRDRLQNYSGPILEPAVGNGRVFIPLLEAGFQLEGFDASEDMLDYCRRECAARQLSPSLTCQTFSDFQATTTFDAIIMPAGSFQLVTQAKAAQDLLRKFHDLLAPGGSLILDIDHMKGLLEPSGAMRRWQVNERELLTLTSSSPEVDYANQTSFSCLRYEHWKDGALLTTEVDFFNLRWWGINELCLALKEAGFDNIEISGGYQHGKPPSNEDLIFSFEAQRRPSTNS